MNFPKMLCYKNLVLPIMKTATLVEPFSSNDIFFLDILIDLYLDEFLQSVIVGLYARPRYHTTCDSDATSAHLVDQFHSDIILKIDRFPRCIIMVLKNCVRFIENIAKMKHLESLLNYIPFLK